MRESASVLASLNSELAQGNMVFLACPCAILIKLLHLAGISKHWVVERNEMELTHQSFREFLSTSSHDLHSPDAFVDHLHPAAARPDPSAAGPDPSAARPKPAGAPQKPASTPASVLSELAGPPLGPAGVVPDLAGPASDLANIAADPHASAHSVPVMNAALAGTDQGSL